MIQSEPCSSILLRRFPVITALASALCWLVPRTSFADEYYYVDWLTADVALGTAMGVITLPDSSTVTVTFEALNSDGSAGNLSDAQTNGGTNYWVPSDPYVSAEVENAPPDPDILQLAGGQDQLYRVTLSEPIRDPIMALVSLGNSATTIQYEFDAPFTIVSQGFGYWGGSATSLVELPSNVLQGTEGHGTIRFIGTFSTFSWTVPLPEFWHGFTFGIRTTERIEPTDAGVADAEASDAVPGDAQEADGGVTPDAGTAVDANSLPDANASADASARADTGAQADAGPRADASTPRDAGIVSDAGEVPDAADGCSCDSQASRKSLGTTSWLLALIGCLWLARRRS